MLESPAAQGEHSGARALARELVEEDWVATSNNFPTEVVFFARPG
jgi:hypothetical protein